MNDGFCANGTCNCKEGYTGSDCSQEKTPSSITITAVTVTKWPATESNGGGWDLFDGPDLTFILRKNGTNVYSSDIFYENAVQGQSYTFNTNIELLFPDESYQLELYDYDSSSAYDLISDISFIPFIEGKDFPSTGRAENSIIAFELEMTYKFN